MDAALLIDATAAPLYELGGAYAFTPATAALGEQLGLDVFLFYCLGRGGVLGDVDADTVVDAFTWSNPSVVRAQWDEARAIADPATVAAAYLGAAHAYARQTFKESDTLRGFAAAATRVVGAVPAGRWALVDGYGTFELPADAVARAFQLVVILRELRLAATGEAIAQVGLTPPELHVLDIDDAFELYGFEPADVPAITDELVERRALAEDRTTELLSAYYDVLDDGERGAFLDGVRELAATADVDVEGVAD